MREPHVLDTVNRAGLPVHCKKKKNLLFFFFFFTQRAYSAPHAVRRSPRQSGPRSRGASRSIEPGPRGSTALSQPRLARMTENQDSLSALRAETLRGLAGQREREEEAERERDRGCWCCWLTVPVVLAVALALPVVWESHIRLWHNALTDPYTLGGVAVTFMCALYGLLQCIDLGDK